MKKDIEKQRGKKSIFRSLFVPLFVILILQALIFYFAAVYGGIEESLSQNSADILTERLTNRKNEIETLFNNKWSNLSDCEKELGAIYDSYENDYGDRPLTTDKELQISFLKDSLSTLIGTLRHNEVNGVFLILNDDAYNKSFDENTRQQKYGLCIRDMDQDNSYEDTEDLLIERAPSSLIDSLNCSLDSWWEARYTFTDEEDGSFYYYPLKAAWDNYGADSSDLAYCSDAYQLSGSDPAMISYSIPLIDGDGYPYGVLGVELSVKYLSSLMPNKELNDADKCCYILAIKQENSDELTPITATGTLYNRCFSGDSVISCADTNATGGFSLKGRGDVELYGVSSQLDIYNTNNPFENRQLTLAAIVETQTLFKHISRIKMTLFVVSVISLFLGILGLGFVSRRFASPITALAKRVRSMDTTQKDFDLDRLGITEIDQLVDSIEELNSNVNKNSARTEFFSRMSHDMRTPMNAIISFSSPELLEGADEVTKDDYIKKIHDSGEYLLELINEVLDMTKIESNKIDLRREVIKADKLFSMTLPIIEKLTQKKNIEFTLDISAAPDDYVVTDVQHLNQIVMNLLSNAVKFTPDGGKVNFGMKITVYENDPSLLRCNITVADTGVGMSEDFLKELYTPFEQENDEHEGTGLGLSIAKKLIDLMNGTIDCVSVKNRGTVFTLNFDFEKAPEPLQETSEEIKADTLNIRNLLSGKKILVCEDNAINTEIICRLLDKSGAVTVTAKDGQAGLDTFIASEINEFSLILMDIRMPVMDGLETSRAIRALSRKDAASVPIVAMTANAFAEDVDSCKNAGMNEHLSKPIDPQKLFDTLTKYIN